MSARKTRAEHGGHVWVNTGEPDLWLLSKVLMVNEHNIKVEVIGNSLEDSTNENRGTILETSKILGYDSQQLEDCNDALRMTGELNEASLLQLLRRRFSANTIYTFLGDVLVSINPYQDVGALTAASMPPPEELESKEQAGTVIPHLHVVSERAHRRMLTHGPKGTSQSILINGESGSGKTEAAKCIMKCLAQRSYAKRQVLKKEATAGLNNNLKRMGVFGASQLENRGLALLGSKGRGRGAGKMSVLTTKELDGSEDVEDAGSKVERSFILSNPLLEAFGNSKTVNNHNSSRFGKFVKIEYDDDGCIVGTNTRAFFLEKSRLVRRALGERNFHSFYQLLNAYRANHFMLVGGDDEGFKELDQFMQQVPNLLQASSKVDNRRRDDDGEDEEDDDDAFNEDIGAFEATNKSMESMGLDEEDQKKVWKMVALILVIGDLEFAAKDVPEKRDNLERSGVVKGLDLASQLLSVKPEVLEMALCQRSVRAGRRGSVTYTPLSPERARESNEGLAKAMYSSLFTWLVERVNEASREATANVQKSRRKEPLFIGVLDIFGFEVLRTNSFEQLCINYANEVMQKFFDSHVFQLEHQVYKEEGVDSSKFTFRDNTPIINLLSGKPSGIFRVLDEQGMMGDAATDLNFLQKIDTAHRGDTEHYRVRPVLHLDGLFEVKHFAGSVIYDVREFIAKNKDILESDLSELLTSLATSAPEGSVARFVGNVFVDVYGEKDSTASVFQQQTTSNRRLTTLETVSGRFRSQMNDLSVVLDATDQNFIRCVKPNKVKKPLVWDAPLVLNQLKYLSVMEMVRIRTEGFPVRIPFPDLVSKFPELLTPTKFIWYPGTNDKRACETLLRAALGEDSEHVYWVSGSTKCFMRDGVLEQLMSIVRVMKNRAAAQVQKLVRGFMARRRYRKQRAAAIQIQRWFREHCKSSALTTNTFATKIQSAIRGRFARKERDRRLQAIVLIQRFRRQLMRDRRARRMQKIVKLQAWFRSIRCVRQFWKFRMNVVLLQARVRGVFVRGRYRKLLESREPWKAYLFPNEAIVLTSLVVKTSDVHGVRSITNLVGSLGGLLSSKKHRQLIFTTGPGSNELDPVSAPRLFYVNPVAGKWKGEIPYDTGLTCGLSLGDKDFLIFSRVNDDKQDKTPVWTFTDLLGPAVCWIRSIRRNVSVLELVRDPQPSEFHTRVPPSHSGPLLMRQLIGPKKYIDLFFTLVGTDLWWIHAPGQTTPSGGVNLTGSCSVRIIENPRALPGVPSFAFWLDIPCRPKPLKFRTNDPDTMKAWVVAIERAIRKCKEDEATKNDPVALADRIFQSGCALFDASNFLGAKIKFKDALDMVIAKGNSRSEAIQIQFDCLEHRARCNFVLGLYEKALNDSTEALQLKRGNESCMRTRAASFEKLNRFQESLDEYDRLILLFPTISEFPVLKDRVRRSMEIMKGKSSSSSGFISAASGSAIGKQKAPAIARQFSKDFVKESARSGILGVPDTVSPSAAEAKRQLKFKSFAYVGTTSAKRKMDEEDPGVTTPAAATSSSSTSSFKKPPPPLQQPTLKTDGKRISGSFPASISEPSSKTPIGSLPPPVPPSRTSTADSMDRSSGSQEYSSKHHQQQQQVRPPSLSMQPMEEDLLAEFEVEPEIEPISPSTPIPPPPPPLPPVVPKPSAPAEPVSKGALLTSNKASPSTSPSLGKKSSPLTNNATRNSPILSAAFAATPTETAAIAKPSTSAFAKAMRSQTPPLQQQIGSNSNESPSPSASPPLKKMTSKPAGETSSSPPAAVEGGQTGVEKKVIKLKKRPTSGSGGISFARAIADYTPGKETAQEDLTFKKGDEILVLHKFKDGWWKGSLRGAQGLFPSTFVQLMDIRDAKDVLPQAPPSSGAVSHQKPRDDDANML